jgi:hypothetical protein
LGADPVERTHSPSTSFPEGESIKRGNFAMQSGLGETFSRKDMLFALVCFVLFGGLAWLIVYDQNQAFEEILQITRSANSSVPPIARTASNEPRRGENRERFGGDREAYFAPTEYRAEDESALPIDLTDKPGGTRRAHSIYLDSPGGAVEPRLNLTAWDLDGPDEARMYFNGKLLEFPTGIFSDEGTVTDWIPIDATAVIEGENIVEFELAETAEGEQPDGFRIEDVWIVMEQGANRRGGGQRFSTDSDTGAGAPFGGRGGRRGGRGGFRGNQSGASGEMTFNQPGGEEIRIQYDAQGERGGRGQRGQRGGGRGGRGGRTGEPPPLP